MEEITYRGEKRYEVIYAGMKRQFKYDWQAKFHYEACCRLYRSKIAKEFSP